jgi:hypothetical protein
MTKTFSIDATREIKDWTGKIIGYEPECVWEGASLESARKILKQVKKQDSGATIREWTDGTMTNEYRS